MQLGQMSGFQEVGILRKCVARVLTDPTSWKVRECYGNAVELANSENVAEERVAQEVSW